MEGAKLIRFEDYIGPVHIEPIKKAYREREEIQEIIDEAIDETLSSIGKEYRQNGTIKGMRIA